MHFLTLLLSLALTPNSHTATCDSALEELARSGALNPDSLSIRQRCTEEVATGRRSSKSYSFCLLSGEPKKSGEEKYGNRAITAIVAEDEESRERFSAITGTWFNYEGKPLGNKAEKESVSVTVNNLGSTVSRKRYREFSKSYQLEKFIFSNNEGTLRHEIFSKTGNKASKPIAEKTYDCERSLNQAELEEQEKKAKSVAADSQYKGVRGTVKVKPAKPEHRNSGITEKE